MASRPWVLMIAVLGGCADESMEATARIRGLSTMLVTDRGGDRVVAYLSDGSLVGTLIDRTSCDLNRPSSTRVGPDEHLFVASFGNGTVFRFEPNGSGETVFFSDAVLEEPVELLFADDSLYVLGNDTRSIAVVDADGHLERSFGYPALRDAHDFAFGPDGLLYVCTAPSGHADGVVQIWDPLAGEMVRSFASTDVVELASSIAFGPDGLAYVSDYRRGRIAVFDPRTGEHQRDLPPAFTSPIAIELGPDDALYVVDRAGIWAVFQDAATLIVDGADLDSPRGVSFY